MTPSRIATIIVLTLLLTTKAQAGDYLNSAHGNASYGVDRLNSPYATGNCAHCHEQHASIDGDEPAPADGSATKHALFTSAYTSATDNFCVECHDGTTSIASSAIINHSYSYRAGGLTTDFPSSSSIKDIFDIDSTAIASVHNLDDIKTLLSTPTIGGVWGYTNNSHPCEGCHNPHAVQGDPANSDDGRKTYGSRGYPLSRPSQHNPLANWSVWGDDSTEKMSTFASGGMYQAPYYYGSTSNHEPENNATEDGSNLTDMNSFCIDCHNMDILITSTNLGTVKQFDWDLEVHGKGIAEDLPARTECQPPFTDGNQGSYILSCTDCHEPHGSSNIYLIRPVVNGNTVSLPTGTTDWRSLCSSCHVAASDLKSFHHKANDGYDCYACHPTGRGPVMNPCTDCHFHSSSNDYYKLF